MSAANRAPVELAKAYRLLNHGPTVLVSAAHDGRANVMAAAWNMPLDFDPPKVAVVLDKSTFTRGLIEGSGEFVLNVPCRAQAGLTVAVGSTSGRDEDKIATLKIATAPGSVVAAPLVEDCVAWLECRRLPQPALEAAHDLFLGEVVAAWADPRAFSNGRWHFDDEALRTIHHVAGGAFMAIGEAFKAG
ncbi:flavin reductase family protein [Caldimonas tepidiphila]|uniref:flavin reductase family protein n=1 Tax=Caldimonas tepidiphila TaxID=2315841 RepID=UPI000E5A8A89|nr:flavin reductase family protein [Caldimonas tepidiphila]